MNTDPEDISWGRYMQFQGPFFRGIRKFEFSEVTASSPEVDKRVGVISSTEGGAYDAINMYDRCICSVGLIQFCDAGMFGVCDMLGAIMDRCPKELEDFLSYMRWEHYEFEKQSSSKWRFVNQVDDEVVDTIPEQRRLWIGSSDGMTWDQPSKALACLNAAYLANIWDSQEARAVQRDFTNSRLLGFVMPEVRPRLFAAGGVQNNIVSAAQAAYLSFAANLPAVASKQFLALNSANAFGSYGWLVDLLRQLTFGPNIAINPARYNAIRPRLEAYYGIDLPDFATELQQHVDTFTKVHTVKDIQERLIQLGYTLGPSGADGIAGKLTSAAIMQFQQLAHLKVDGIIGPNTMTALFADAA